MKAIDRIYDSKYRYIMMILMIIAGGLISGISFNAFIMPHKLLSGGISGISLILNYLFDINVGLLIFVINMPIFIIGLKFVDREFIVLSLIGMITFSISINLFTFIQDHIYVKDVMLSSIYGGILNGIGMGVVFRNRASQGGIDIIAVIVKKYLSVNIGTTSMMINTAIVVFSSLLYGIEIAMYTLISMYIASAVLDKVQQGFNKRKSVMIISDKEKEVAEAIFTRLVRGVTYLEGEGAYTGSKKRVIYCIVTLNQLAKLKQIVREIDTSAFVTVSDTAEVMGQGFANRGI